MTDLRALLQQIKDGKRSFRPASDSSADIEAFQDIAKALAFVDGEGFLDGFVSHKESYTSNRWYVVVLVKTGLSYQGQQYLERPNAPTVPPPGDVVQFKPNFHGIGIDLQCAVAPLERENLTTRSRRTATPPLNSSVRDKGEVC